MENVIQTRLSSRFRLIYDFQNDKVSVTPEELLKERIELQSESMKIIEAVEMFSRAFFDRALPTFDRAQDQDMLLLQAGGPYSWAPEFYNVNMTRQFMHYDDENYNGMQHLMMDLNIAEHHGPEFTFWNEHTQWETFWAEVQKSTLLLPVATLIVTPVFSLTWV